MERCDHDKLAQVSLNGIYVKALELDRGHNDAEPPKARPAGAVACADVSTHASDAVACASRASDAEARASEPGLPLKPDAGALAGGKAGGVEADFACSASAAWDR